MNKLHTQNNFRLLIVFSFTVTLLVFGAVKASYFVVKAQNQKPIVYQTNFDQFVLGQLQPFPGHLRQGGWFHVLGGDDSYGEIQDQIALGGNSLHQHTGATVPANYQTIDQINLTPRSLNGTGTITLSADFFPVTSNLEATNGFNARLLVAGGPHPGYEIISFVLGGGHSATRNETGVFVGLPTYSIEQNNIVPVPLTVGTHLAWNSWHNVKVVIDQTNDTYRSITVDGFKQDLDGFKPYRNTLDGVNWVRGQLIEKLEASIVPLGEGVNRTDDDIYWDNIQVRVTPK